MSFVCGLNCYFMFVIKRNLLFWWKTPQTPHSLNFKIIYLSSVLTSRLLPIMLHRKTHPRLDMSFKETMHYIWQFFLSSFQTQELLFFFLFYLIQFITVIKYILCLSIRMWLYVQYIKYTFFSVTWMKNTHELRALEVFS